MEESKQEPVLSFNQRYNGVGGSQAAQRRAKKNIRITLGGLIVIILLGCVFLAYNIWKYKYAS